MTAKDSFKVDHQLFDEITFPNAEAAERAAERLCLFLIKNTDRREIHIEVLRYAEEQDNDGEIKTQWWFHKNVSARLTVGDEE